MSTPIHQPSYEAGYGQGAFDRAQEDLVRVRRYVTVQPTQAQKAVLLGSELYRHGDVSFIGVNTGDISPSAEWLGLVDAHEVVSPRDVNVARLIRENESLRKVAAAAARLRRIGKACDQIEEGAEDLWRENPDMTRSGTRLIMAREAYDEALKAFDATLLGAADVFARDPFADDLALWPDRLKHQESRP